jgi:hypothetical protein
VRAAGATPPRYGTGVRGYFRDSVQFRMESIRVRTSRVLGVLLYIYLIDVNLDELSE